MSNYTVLVCGGRDFDDAQLFVGGMSLLPRKPTRIIHGGAKGADTMAGTWAAMNGVPCEVYQADWATYGKAAGPVRNAEMLEYGKPDAVIAFRGGRGTEDMVKKARKAGIEVFVVNG